MARCFTASALCCLALPVVAAFGACPNNITPSAPRWSHTGLEWNYMGIGLSNSDVAAGASSWNSRQSFTTIQPTIIYDDINIWDDNNIGTDLANITVFNYQQSGSACYLKQSVNCPGVCFNTSRINFADIRLSPNNIAGAAYGWASNWSLSQSDALSRTVKMVVAHELGHFFGLSNWDPGAANCTDPTIVSVFDIFYCQLFSGPTSCDGSTVGSIYSGWAVYTRACGFCSSSSPACSN